MDIGLDASIDCGNWQQALEYTQLLVIPYRYVRAFPEVIIW